MQFFIYKIKYKYNYKITMIQENGIHHWLINFCKVYEYSMLLMIFDISKFEYLE